MTRMGRKDLAEVLRERIVTGLHVGRVSGGERLPSTRALATEFDVNERVVLAALRSLAGDGFVELRPRSGAYVLPPHPGAAQGLPDLGAWMVSILGEGRSRGIPPRELPEYMRRCLETRRVRAACIECNRDQLHLLCSELVNDHGYESEPVEVGDLSSASTQAALRRADVLVTTVFHKPEVQAAAESLNKPCIAVALRSETMATVSRRLRDDIVYFVATDRRFEKKLQRMLAPMGPIDNLRILILDRDDTDAIPAGAPTFVMTSARARMAERYGSSAGPGDPIHPARHLSDEASADLLGFLVRANMAALAVPLV